MSELGAGQPAFLLIYVTCIDGEIEGVRMLDIYAPTASAPENNAGTVGCSDMLRYTESDVYLVDGRVKGVPDDMVGKHGLAWFRPSESRWYFREYGTDDSRLVEFHQLGLPRGR